jgi:hypothetical protein
MWDNPRMALSNMRLAFPGRNTAAPGPAAPMTWRSGVEVAPLPWTDCGQGSADAATLENRQVEKLRIWARQWRAAKPAPRTYGEKLEVAGSAENPLTLLIQGSAGARL